MAFGGGAMCEVLLIINLPPEISSYKFIIYDFFVFVNQKNKKSIEYIYAFSIIKFKNLT